MPEPRTDRTPFLSLLALMQAAADLDDYSFPYWNALQVDACLAGLHQAPRTGAPLLTSPAAPTLALLGAGGMLAGGQTLEVGQTFVDTFGRETAPSVVATISTGDAIPDPLDAPTLSDPATAGSGFEGGTLEAWYSWTDASGGETGASPEAVLDLPYLAAGLYNTCTFTLPAPASDAGAAGANVYIRFRGGNIVLAKRIQSTNITTCTLDATVVDCYRSLPLSNTTNGSKAIQITGAPANGSEAPVYTRFYIRAQGATWPGDRRLRVGGADQWDPATVTYPLLYAGLSSNLAPGFPPATSLVKAIRPIDLATEITGLLDSSHVTGGGGGVDIVPYGTTPPDPAPGKLTVVQNFWGAQYMLRADQSDDIDDSQYLPLHLWGYAGLGDYLGFLGFFNDLTALQAQGYEPWSGVDCLAYVADTDAWYTWEEVQQAMSVGDVSPATDLSSGTAYKFDVSVDGGDPVTIELDKSVCVDFTSTIAEITKRLQMAGFVHLNAIWMSDHYGITGQSRTGDTIVITDGPDHDVAASLKLGVANGGDESTVGQGGWVKTPSSGQRGTFADVPSLPGTADEGDTAWVLDNGSAVVAMMRYESEAWVQKGTLA